MKLFDPSRTRSRIRSLALGGLLAVTASLLACPAARSRDRSTAHKPTNLPMFAYAVNRPGAKLIFQYQVGPDGTLTSLNPPSIPTTVMADTIVSDPHGRFVYLASFSDPTISQYRVRTDGTLAPLSPPTVTLPDGYPEGMVVSPDGRNLYVSTRIYHQKNNIRETAVTQFRLHADGTLAALSPVSVLVAESHPAGPITIDAHGRFVSVLIAPETVSQLRVNEDGTLTRIASTFADGGDVHAVTSDAAGRFVYVACNDEETIWQYKLNPDGTLSALTPPFVKVGNVSEPSNDLIYLAHHPSRPFVYAADIRSGTVITFGIDASGTLSRVGSVLHFPYGTTGLAVDPSGRYLYNTGGGPVSGSISQSAIGSDGVPYPLSPFTIFAGEDLDGVVVVRPQSGASHRAAPPAISHRRRA